MLMLLLLLLLMLSGHSVLVKQRNHTSCASMTGRAYPALYRGRLGQQGDGIAAPMKEITPTLKRLDRPDPHSARDAYHQAHEGLQHEDFDVGT